MHVAPTGKENLLSKEYLFKMRQKHTCMNNLLSGQVDKWYILIIFWECLGDSVGSLLAFLKSYDLLQREKGFRPVQFLAGY